MRRSGIRLPALLLSLILGVGQGAATAAEISSGADVRTVYGLDNRNERRAFEQAIADLRSGRTRGFERAAAELSGYVLAPYLEYYDTLRSVSRLAPEDVEAFRTRHADSPLPDLLEFYWLRRASRAGRWDVLAAAPVEPGRAPEIVCRQAVARLRAGRESEAFALAPELWTVPESQHEHCDPLFDRWQAVGGITPARAWTRLQLALEAGQTRLARYLLRFVPEALTPLAEALLRARSAPEQVLQEIDSMPVPAGRPPAAMATDAAASAAAADDWPVDARADLARYALARLARQAADRALLRLRRLAGDGVVSGTPLARAEYEVVLRLWLDRASFLDDYVPLTPTPDEAMHELLARHQIRRADWGRLLAVIESMPRQLQVDERWRYWQARAIDALEGSGAGHGIFFELASQRSWYGFLAASRVDQPLAMNDTGSPIDPARLAGVLARPAVRRVIELKALDRNTEAHREWRFLLDRLDEGDARALAHVARLHGWHDLAIRATIDAGLWNDLELRFPLAWHEQFQQAAHDEGLAPHWLYGIARQESALDPDARSPVGARGLMQLMPNTAVATARASNRSTPDPRELDRPEVNVPLGARYYATMLAQFDDNRALAAAAYNAGPHRARGWLRMPTDQPLDIWVETIPFRETRGYVQNVLAFSAIYGWRMGLTPTLLGADERRVRARP